MHRKRGKSISTYNSFNSLSGTELSSVIVFPRACTCFLGVFWSKQILTFFWLERGDFIVVSKGGWTKFLKCCCKSVE